MKHMPNDILDDGQSLNDQVDNTTEKNEEDALKDIPDEDDLGLDDKKTDDEEDKKPNRSEVAQKIKYREKYLSSQDKIRELEAKIETMGSQNKPTELEEKELAAQKYIRKQAREEYESIKAEESAREEKELEVFQDKLDEALEANPDFTEDQILGICEEFTVEPAVAVKILKRAGEAKSAKKPSLPTAKRGSTEVGSKEKADDTKKSIYEIAQEVKKMFKK